MTVAPRPDQPPEGPLAELIAALHALHRAAGKPSARRISTAIRDRDDLRDTVSHETINAMLRGTGLPKWIKVECVVRQLSAWAVTDVDPDQELRRFHQLWLAASDEPDAAPGTPPRAVVRDFLQPPAATPHDDDGPSAGRPSGPLITNGPPRAGHFTGRHDLLDRIRGHFTVAGRPPLALVGLGGVGKTQLAIEYAHRWSTEYDIVWWVPAEQPSQTAAALVALGEQLELPVAVDMRQTSRSVLSTLDESSLRWLLVYDNADDPADLAAWLPATGDVIVTSRNPAWADAAATEPVGVFSREESLGFLRVRGVTAAEEAGNALAEQLGDLPLALDQVCAMQRATGMPVDEYLRLFAEHLDELLAGGRRAGSRTTTVTTLVNVAFGRLGSESPAAARLLLLLAFMAPLPVPLALLHAGRDGAISQPLGRALMDTEALRRIAGLAARYGLAQLSPDGQQLQMHRVVQVVLREALDPADAEASRLDAHRLLAAPDPGDPADERNWARLAEIGPHLVATRAVHARDLAPRQAVVHQIRYLERIGDFEASVQIGRAAVEAWRRPLPDGGLGADHELTIRATRQLANALRALGHYDESRSMIVQTLDRLRRSPQYGEDHPLTQETAAVAAFHLRISGSYREALDLDQARVERLRQRYDETHPDTLFAMCNLTINLRLRGDARAALPMDEFVGRHSTGETNRVAIRNIARDLLDLGRYREALDRIGAIAERSSGRRDDDVVIISQTEAIVLRRLGRHDEAMAAARDTYRRCQQRFGPDHHLTLSAIMTYANTLRAVGDAVGARSLATEALDRYRRLFGEDNPLTLAAATNHAIVLRALGRWREAYGVDEVTHDEMRRILGPEHPHTLATAVGLATDLARHHNAKEAVALGQETVAMLARVRGEDHPETWACAVNLALDLHGADTDPHRAAVGGLAGVLGDDHPEVRAAANGARLECDIEPPPT